MFFLTTAPFLVSTRALSLQWRDLLFVCLIRSLFSICATKWLINSLPLSEWKLKITKGYWDKRSSIAGPNVLSAIVGTQTIISHWVISSTLLIWYTSLWCTVNPYWTWEIVYFRRLCASYSYFSRFCRVNPRVNIDRTMSKIIDMRDRNMGKILVFLMFKYFIFSPEYFMSGNSVKSQMKFIRFLQ